LTFRKVNFLVPELVRRGVHWADYPVREDGKGITAREGLYGIGQGAWIVAASKQLTELPFAERLRSDHFGAQFKWAAGQEAPTLVSGQSFAWSMLLSF
jgi:hypothetical protein